MASSDMNTDPQFDCLSDGCMRTALKRELISFYSHDPDTLIIDELGLRHGAARIDLAVINGTLSGFEFKSDLDSLARLPAQVRIYNSVFDRLTLVVVKRHLVKAQTLVPLWWGIKIAEQDSTGEVQFVVLRHPSTNPSPDMFAITKLLWREEALSLLETLGLADGVRSKPRAAIYARLAEVAERDWLREQIRYHLRSRADWRVDEPQESDDGSLQP